MAEISHHDIAVVTAPDLDRSLEDFPRDANWRPTSTLRLHAREGGRRSDVDSPHWELQACHSTGEASTALVYRGELTPVDSRDGPRTIPVVIKIRRRIPIDDVEKARIEKRFDYELRALVEVSNAAADKSLFATIYDPDGQVSVECHPHGIGESMWLCLAANHALKSRKRPEHGELTDAAMQVGTNDDPRDFSDDRIPLASDDQACKGCRIFGSSEPIEEKRRQCRKWLVTAAPETTHEQRGLVPLQAAPALILSYLGPSLQQHMSEPRLYTYESLCWKLQAVTELARRMKLMHDAGWLHLDLNPNNICVREDPPSLIPIDFGQCERIPTTLRHRQALEERVPFRQLEYAAPELQLRQFEFHFCNFEFVEANNAITFSGKDVFLGWPTDWRPQIGDLIRFKLKRNDGLDVVVGGNVIGEGRRDGYFTVQFNRDVSPARTFRRNARVSATLFRTATTRTDVYTFGLIILSLLFRHDRVVIIRDELTVVRRIIRKRRDKAESIWFRYRNALPAHSAILDEAMPNAITRLAEAGEGNRERAEFLFFQLAELGIACVLRGAAPTSLHTFEQILAFLERVQYPEQSPRNSREAILPVSLFRHCEEITRERRSVMDKLSSARGRIARDFDKCARGVRSLVKRLKLFQKLSIEKNEITTFAGQVEREAQSEANQFDVAYKRLGALTRNVIIPLYDGLRSITDGAASNATNPPVLVAAGINGVRLDNQGAEKIERFLEDYRELLSPDEKSFWVEFKVRLVRLRTLSDVVAMSRNSQRFRKMDRGHARQLTAALTDLRHLASGMASTQPSLNGQWVAETTNLWKQLDTLVRSTQDSVRKYRQQCVLDLANLKKRHESIQSRLLESHIDLARIIYAAISSDYEREFGEVEKIIQIIEACDTNGAPLPPLPSVWRSREIDECLSRCTAKARMFKHLLEIWKPPDLGLPNKPR